MHIEPTHLKCPHCGDDVDLTAQTRECPHRLAGTPTTDQTRETPVCPFCKTPRAVSLYGIDRWDCGTLIRSMTLEGDRSDYCRIKELRRKLEERESKYQALDAIRQRQAAELATLRQRNEVLRAKATRVKAMLDKDVSEAGEFQAISDLVKEALHPKPAEEQVCPECKGTQTLQLQPDGGGPIVDVPCHYCEQPAEEPKS